MLKAVSGKPCWVEFDFYYLPLRYTVTRLLMENKILQVS